MGPHLLGRWRGHGRRRADSDTDEPIIDAFAEYERRLSGHALVRRWRRRRSGVSGSGTSPSGWPSERTGACWLCRSKNKPSSRSCAAYGAKGYALIDIASEFNTRGLRNRQGRPWRCQFVGQLLERHPAKIA